MAEDDPNKAKSDFERMSLASLKRELASQQAQTEQQRADAKDRLAAEQEKAKAFPWQTLVMVLLGGVVFFVLVAFGLQASFPAAADYMIPDFVYHPWDGGPPPARPDAAHVDAGMPDTGAPHHAHHATHPTPTGTGDDLGLGTTGGSGDPLEGLPP